MKTLQLRLIPLGELRLDECKYPAKDTPTAIGGYLFCGRPVKSGEIYCQEHKEICRQGPLASPGRGISYSRSGRKPSLPASQNTKLSKLYVTEPSR
jgi:hypothetical protein